MKIGILTYHRSNNYGALLQAIALRKVLSDMGNVVTFIDYWPAYHRHVYEAFSIASLKYRSLRNNLNYTVYCLRNYISRKKRIKKFDIFINHYIVPYLSSTKDEYDIIVHGSDQIWRKQFEIKVYNPVYFGKHNISAKRKISYAASMGIIAKTEEDKQLIKSYLLNLDGISVREENLKDMVQQLGFRCELHVDPVFLLNKEQWNSLVPITSTFNEKYILYYCLQLNAFDISEIQKFAKKRRFKLKIIYGKVFKKDTLNEIAIANPQDLLNLIREAEFVFTSSFHGLAFSLIYQKPFYASFKRNSGRAESLLSQLSLIQYLLEPQSAIPLDYKEIDYHLVDNKISQMREKAYKYLRESAMM